MRAIIVGAGIGGLSAALALRRAGIDATVLERADDPRTTQVGGGFHLWGNALRASRKLGLEERFEDIGAVIRHTEFFSWRGKHLAEWPVAEVSGAVDAVDLGVSRADLQRVLHDAAGEWVVPGAELVSFSDDGDGVTATLADGRIERGDLLVGADGLRSAVRSQLLGPARPDYSGYVQWQTVTREGADLLGEGMERIFFGPGLRTVFHHVGGGQLFWAAVTYGPESDAGAPPGRKRTLLERFRGWPEPIEAAIEGTPEDQIVGLAVYDRKPVKRWGEGRVTLLGDAAHPMTTNTSQGGNQAIEDGVVLANCLSADGDVSGALRRYEEQRIPRTALLVKRSRQAADWNAWRDPVRCRVRDIMLSKLLPGPALKELRASVAVEL
jgi:2-polyprenyl-6-methoxyphenol hydroxylase-like FAD-dependent oxidoreductase